MALCLAVICTACNRQKTVSDNLDDYFDAVEDRFMGSVTVLADGMNVYQRHIGFSDVANQVRATDGTRYHIGSIGLQLDLIAGKGHLFIDQMGQIIPLKTLSDSTFECSAAGLEIIMDAQGRGFTMKQNGMDFHAERQAGQDIPVQ